jgi:hypothetical protein
MSGWSETTPLDGSRTNFATVAAAGNLYVLGGFSLGTGMSQRLVQRAAINPDGSLGPWLPASPMVTARGDFRAVAWGDYIYAIGASMGAGLPIDGGIERARVNPDGSLDPWEPVQSTAYMPSRMAAVVVRDYLFVMDGLGGPRVLRAHFAADGSLEQWEMMADTAGQSETAAASGPFIYALNEDGSIERSALRPEGTLEPWVGVASTNDTHRYGALAVLDGYLYVLGGEVGNSPNAYTLTSVERATINPDGSLGPWERAPSLRSGHSFFSAGVWEHTLYASGEGYSGGARVVEFSRARPANLTERLYLPTLGAPRT